MYKFNFILTEEDYIAFNMHHNRNSKMLKKMLLATRIIFPIVMFLLATVFGHVLGRWLIAYASFAIATLLWFFSNKSFSESFTKRMVKLYKKEGKLPYDANVQLTFEDDSLVQISESGEQKTFYSAYERIEFDDNAIYLYQNSLSAVILPLRIFASDEEREQLLAFIRPKIVAFPPQE